MGGRMMAATTTATNSNILYNEIEPGLNSFGHGIFQKCSLKPLIIQSEGFLISSHFFECSAKNVLLLNQQLIIGIEVLHPLHEKLTNSSSDNEREQISKIFQKYAEYIHFNFTFSLLDSKSESVLYGESSFVNTLEGEKIESKSVTGKDRYLILDDRVVFFKKTTLKLAPYLENKVLKVSMSLSIPLKQRGIGACDSKETELRYLLDRNRYRPTPISPLIISIGVEIANRITVTTSMRELSFESTLVTVSIGNNFHANRIRITNCTLHMERSCDGQGQWCGGSFPSVFRVDYLTPHSDEAVVVEPQESYNLVYKISFNSAQWARRSDTTLIDAIILGHFSTPATVFYTTQLIVAPAPNPSQSPLEWQLVNLLLNDNNSSSKSSADIDVTASQLQAESPLECTVVWSIGTTFASTPLTAEVQKQMTHVATSLLHLRGGSAVPSSSHNNFQLKSSSSTASQSDDGDGDDNNRVRRILDKDRDRVDRGVMDVYVEWPNRVVEVDTSFTIKLQIVSRDSVHAFRDLVMMTCPATPPIGYVIQESIVKLRYAVNNTSIAGYWFDI